MIVQPVDLTSFLKFRLWQSIPTLAEHTYYPAPLLYTVHIDVYTFLKASVLCTCISMHGKSMAEIK